MHGGPPGPSVIIREPHFHNAKEWLIARHFTGLLISGRSFVVRIPSTFNSSVHLTAKKTVLTTFFNSWFSTSEAKMRLHTFFTSFSFITLLLSPPTTSVPILENIACKPSSIPLGTTFRLTFQLRDDPKKPARGVANLQVFAQNALPNSSQYGGTTSTTNLATVTMTGGAEATETAPSEIDIPPPPEPLPDSTASSNDPVTRVQNVVDLEAGGMDVEFDWYRFGPYGIVNYVNQPLWYVCANWMVHFANRNPLILRSSDTHPS